MRLTRSAKTHNYHFFLTDLPSADSPNSWSKYVWITLDSRWTNQSHSLAVNIVSMCLSHRVSSEFLITVTEVLMEILLGIVEMNHGIDWWLAAVFISTKQSDLQPLISHIVNGHML